MSKRNKILCEIWDCELEDLQVSITLNPDIKRIKMAMALYADCSKDEKNTDNDK